MGAPTIAINRSGYGWARAQDAIKALGRLWRPRQARRLRLCESLALGERRFVAVIEFERQRFLIGGSAAAVALLALLPQASSAQSVPVQSIPAQSIPASATELAESGQREQAGQRDGTQEIRSARNQVQEWQ